MPSRQSRRDKLRADYPSDGKRVETPPKMQK